MKLKNSIIFFLVKFFNFFTKKNEIEFNAPKILILSTTGLGDTLWATPFLKEIKTHYPKSKISFLTTFLGQKILQNCPYIDNFFIFSKRRLAILIYLLKKQKIQIVFHLHTSQRLVLPIASVIGAKKIVGYKGKTKGLDFLLSNCFSEENVHEIEKRLKLLETVKIFAKVTAPKYYFKNEPTVKKRTDHPHILIHPGAKDGYKIWPIESYVILAKMYVQAYGAKIFFSFGFADSHLKTEVLKISKEFTIIENKSIDNLANELINMQLVVTNDTGPMHLAAAVDTPTIGIFSVTDPKISGPVGENAITVYRKRTCTPCLMRKCCEPFCFYQISPNNVFEISKKFLDK